MKRYSVLEQLVVRPLLELDCAIKMHQVAARSSRLFLFFMASGWLAAAALLLWPAALADAQVFTRGTSVAPPKNPQHIVSINPCADALLMQLTEPRNIRSISHYSHDPRATSIPIAQALRFSATSGTAEEIIAMRPDLVIASSYVAPATERALDRLGVAVIKLSIPQSVAESQRQISALSQILGSPARGKNLNRRISQAIAKARPADQDFVPALIWRSGGLVPGSDTLPDELLRLTGFENRSKTYGLTQWDILPLEHLVARPPTILFSNIENGNARARHKDRMLYHPVLDKLTNQITIAEYPGRLLNCAGPSLIEAANIMAAARRKLRRGK
ncbi:MAG: ABC transporter substrate-binding protein [Parasphingorhabdus sp.]|uniref:ABC transporter substrate-binding protein n=1 Tax=Parasphingorhabdus sp. TaxID=2709688 RepID=UPI00329683ED